MIARMQALKSKLLNLLRGLGNAANALRTHRNSVFSFYLQTLFVLFILLVSLAIGQFFIAADSSVTLHSSERATEILVQIKYTILAGYTLSWLVIGVIVRLFLNRRNLHTNGMGFWLDGVTSGILVGGLTSAKLAGIVAIVRELSVDEAAVNSDSITFLAMAPIVIIVLAAYFTAKEVIMKTK